LCCAPLVGSEVSAGYSPVVVKTNDECDVYILGFIEHLLDSRSALLAGRKLHVQVGLVDAHAGVAHRSHSGRGVVGQRRWNLMRDAAIDVVAALIDLSQDVEGGTDVMDRQLVECLLWRRTAMGKPPEVSVVVRGLADGSAKNAGVGGHTD